MSEVPFVAWLAGLDPRVKCAIPILTDLVNGTAQFERQYRWMFVACSVKSNLWWERGESRENYWLLRLGRWQAGATTGPVSGTCSTILARASSGKCCATSIRFISLGDSTTPCSCSGRATTRLQVSQSSLIFAHISVPDATYDFFEKMNKNQKIYLRSLPNSLHEIDERFRNTIEGFYVAQRSQNKE